MRLILSFIYLIVFVCLGICNNLFSQCNCVNAYVWKFSGKTTNDSVVANLMTRFVEDKLSISSRNCKLLERRIYAKIMQHEENEKNIIFYNDFNLKTIEKLRNTIKADIVILGETELYYDVRLVNIKFVNLETKEVKSNTITFPNSESNNADSVHKYIQILIDKICGEQFTIYDIAVSNPNEKGEGILLDLDPIQIIWKSKGEPIEIELCLENARTNKRTNRIKVLSTESQYTFETQLLVIPYKEILETRFPGETNRIRVVIFTKDKTFISKEFDLYVGILYLVLGEKPNIIKTIPLVDNTSIQAYSFKPKLIMFSGKNDVLFQEQKNKPKPESSFKIDKKTLKKVDWNKIIVFPNCIRIGVDDRMIRFMYAMDAFKYD